MIFLVLLLAVILLCKLISKTNRENRTDRDSNRIDRNSPVERILRANGRNWISTGPHTLNYDQASSRDLLAEAMW
jgi:hypothetical protein